MGGALAFIVTMRLEMATVFGIITGDDVALHTRYIERVRVLVFRNYASLSAVF